MHARDLNDQFDHTFPHKHVSPPSVWQLSDEIGLELCHEPVPSPAGHFNENMEWTQPSCTGDLKNNACRKISPRKTKMGLDDLSGETISVPLGCRRSLSPHTVQIPMIHHTSRRCTPRVHSTTEAKTKTCNTTSVRDPQHHARQTRQRSSDSLPAPLSLKLKRGVSSGAMCQASPSGSEPSMMFAASHCSSSLDMGADELLSIWKSLLHKIMGTA